MPRFLLSLIGLLAGVAFTWKMAHHATTGHSDAQPYVLLGLGWIVVCSFSLTSGRD